MKKTKLQFAVCIKNKDYAASLELRKLYQVVADDSAAKLHQIRVIDESGEDYLYPEGHFAPIQVLSRSRRLRGERRVKRTRDSR